MKEIKNNNQYSKIILIGLLLIICGLTKENNIDCEIRQVRLMLGDDYRNYNIKQEDIKNTATIIYQTYGKCEDSYVKITINNQDTIYYGNQGYREIIHSDWNGEQFCHNGKICQSLVYNQYVHVYKLPVQIGVPFTYTIFADSVKQPKISKVFNSVLPENQKQNNDKVQRIIFFGDQDETLSAKINFKRFSQLKEEGKKDKSKKIDSLIFLGDYGYEYYFENGKVGDSYLDRMQEYFSEWPSVISAGNHEDQYNFKFFNEKFQNPSFNETKNNYFSFNQGLVHFIGVNLHYFSAWANDVDKAKMLNWLEEDLIKANQNRENTPWIVAFGHKPIYCVQNDECMSFPKMFRQIDDLFYTYSVDLFLGAHVHYEQYIKPMYRESIQKFEGNEKNMKYPQGMVTVIQGNGGKANEFMDNFKQNIKYKDQNHPSSFEVNYHIGYGILEVHDSKKLCIKNMNAYLNTVSGNHCIESNHHFNQLLMNTEVIVHTQSNWINSTIIIAISLSVLASSVIAYFLLKNKQN